ncbi:MAG: excinuclease ABC subunit B [Lachnospiraceae bacterium]|jgi:protein arginine kinase activator|nr:excinuclease ABC subunit B [Lachnospiraceae bacterium]
MLCERCKIREANIRYTEVVNGVATEHNLCSHCAKEMDFGQYTGLAGLFDSEYPIGKLISQLLGLGGVEAVEQTDKLSSLVCPTCRTSYGDFVKDSQFGCPDCYHMFDLLISDKLKQLHGSDTHTGKRPAGRDEESEETVFERPLNLTERIELLRSKLKESVAEEDYEAAAAYRDEIRALENKASGGEDQDEMV